MAANYLENHHHNYSITNSPSAKTNLGITQSSMRAAAGLMQTALPRINANQFEKQSSPLTLVKPVT
jgi:predicted transcriptional regulator